MAAEVRKVLEVILTSPAWPICLICTPGGSLGLYSSWQALHPSFLVMGQGLCVAPKFETLELAVFLTSPASMNPDLLLSLTCWVALDKPLAFSGPLSPTCSLRDLTQVISEVL